jgi:hypothetical protein
MFGLIKIIFHSLKLGRGSGSPEHTSNPYLNKMMSMSVRIIEEKAMSHNIGKKKYTF